MSQLIEIKLKPELLYATMMRRTRNKNMNVASRAESSKVLWESAMEMALDWVEFCVSKEHSLDFSLEPFGLSSHAIPDFDTAVPAIASVLVNFYYAALQCRSNAMTGSCFLSSF